MWTLSGFSDEISPDLEEQCALVRKLGMTHLEFRSAWGTNVLDLDGEQLARATRSPASALRSARSPSTRTSTPTSIAPGTPSTSLITSAPATSGSSPSSSLPGRTPTITATRCCDG